MVPELAKLTTEQTIFAQWQRIIQADILLSANNAKKHTFSIETG